MPRLRRTGTRVPPRAPRRRPRRPTRAVRRPHGPPLRAVRRRPVRRTPATDSRTGRRRSPPLVALPCRGLPWPGPRSLDPPPRPMRFLPPSPGRRAPHSSARSPSSTRQSRRPRSRPDFSRGRAPGTRRRPAARLDLPPEARRLASPSRHPRGTAQSRRRHRQAGSRRPPVLCRRGRRRRTRPPRSHGLRPLPWPPSSGPGEPLPRRRPP
jgi:hypothetical protein